ncbi:MAG: nucleoid occlusion factor SlmA [Burkholderiales bacterium]|nr:nucleoid occlusion factor SlmA [Burkholderiales bacterium]
MAQRGERKLAILHALAEMLENPKAEKITTAALAARLQVSEAALYRHFASKAQMFEGLIEFVEQTLFGLINKLCSEESSGLKQVEGTVGIMLGFAQKNPGMTRVLIGDVLVNEDERLQARINQLSDRLEATLRQGLRIAGSAGEIEGSQDAAVTANLLNSFVIGRWHQFAKSGFKRLPMENWPAQWRVLTTLRHSVAESSSPLPLSSYP